MKDKIYSAITAVLAVLVLAVWFWGFCDLTKIPFSYVMTFMCFLTWLIGAFTKVKAVTEED